MNEFLMSAGTIFPQNKIGLLEEMAHSRSRARNVHDESFHTNKQGRYQKLSRYSGVNLSSTNQNWEIFNIIKDNNIIKDSNKSNI